MTPKMIRTFMNAAIEEAKEGLQQGGIPIGSVMVVDDTIVGRGHNRRIQQTARSCTRKCIASKMPDDYPLRNTSELFSSQPCPRVICVAELLSSTKYQPLSSAKTKPSAAPKIISGSEESSYTYWMMKSVEHSWRISSKTIPSCGTRILGCEKATSSSSSPLERCLQIFRQCFLGSPLAIVLPP